MRRAPADAVACMCRQPRTATILAHAMVKSGMKQLASALSLYEVEFKRRHPQSLEVGGANPVQIKSGMEKAWPGDLHPLLF